jgi:hypothetical protein
VGITREWGKEFGRQVARTTSTDFLSWEKCEVVLEGLNANHQIYAMPVFYHGGVYLGLIALHDQKTDRVWTELAWSPDTITWNRVLPGTPLIPNAGKEGDCDWGCAYAAACPVFLEDEIRLYYSGSDGHHFSWRNGFFCLATLRPDGFAGYTQTEADKAATIMTTPVVPPNSTLRITADIAAKGYLKINVFDEHRKLLAKSDPLKVSVSDGKIAWQDGFSFNALGERSIQVHFELLNATVYSFSFSE